jgi:ribosome-binding protein aMBF1 (putative translation factor)
MAAEIVSLTEHHHLSEMHESLRRKLQEAHRKDIAERMNSLRSSVLGAVVSEDYDQAKEELKAYVDYKTNYPQFQERANRYVDHCSDLIQAIQTKRNFPGLASLSLAKQQAIHEKVLEHFEELKQNLKQIEKVEREHKVDDLRTTVWVLRAACHVTFAIFAAAFVIDMQSGLFSSFFQVTNVAVDDASTWLIKLINF